MDDSISRFWDMYITKIKENNVPEGAQRWYVRHIENFIEFREGSRLIRTTKDEVESYIDGIGRKIYIESWQFQQVVDSLRILFSELVCANKRGGAII